MADGFILLIDAFVEDEQRNNAALIRRNLRDQSDPMSMPETQFRSLYRLSRKMVHNLILELSPHLQDAEREELFIPKKLKIMVALHFFAHASYQKAVGQDFCTSMSQSSVSKCLTVVVNALENLYHYVRFPQTQEEVTLVKQGFMNMAHGFPGIVGAVDCTHIAIVAPPINHPDYPAILFYNRKGYYSLNVQIICDANLKILALNARYPGSVHDAAIWGTSQIRQNLYNSYQAGHTSYLLGDSGYPLEPWLMTPITAPDTDAKRAYNIAHRSVRNVIERLNGVLKTRFRCLLKHRVLHYSPPVAAKIVNSCAVLHNMCILHGDQALIDDVPEDEYVQDEHDQQQLQNGHERYQGEQVRTRIVRMYFN
ncbi:hypothetical protein PPYR_02670 [Photinus pyralis]|uniref:DDE Tnp4 domain-containing protein n=1 Tax=Photinus pyralis TaxID=7054 RepID=A0A5N4B9K1_PHOPY|nr:putative nuclease HARBI1 [Photinus pyralis]KAB0805700.1 hypothetical protein PPYR_02670 [Photinus pyralis]